MDNRHFIKRHNGASAMGYGLIIGLIAVTSLAAISGMGGQINTLFTDVSGKLETSQPAFSASPVAAPSASASASPSASPSPSASASPPPPINCQAHRDLGQTADGTYLIDPDGNGGVPAFNIYCNMQGSVGWNLIARNTGAEVTSHFWHRMWADYKAGFGGVASGARNTGWLGLDRMHVLTTGGMDLEVRQLDGSQIIFPYINFSVGNEASKYTLSVNNTTGSHASFGDSHNGLRFTTIDQDNDTRSTGNCATNGYLSGWWYENCWRVIIHSDSAGRANWNGPKDIELWVR